MGFGLSRVGAWRAGREPGLRDITMKDAVGAVTITAYYPKIPASDAAQAMTDETPQYGTSESAI